MYRPPRGKTGLNHKPILGLTRGLLHDDGDFRHADAGFCFLHPRPALACDFVRRCMPRIIDRTLPVRDLQPRIWLPHALAAGANRASCAGRRGMNPRLAALLNDLFLFAMMLMIAAILTFAM